MRFLTLLFALTLTGCYAMTLDEFDSVARWDDPSREPTVVNWSANPKQYPWYSVFVGGADPAPYEEENPSGFARERLDELIDYVGNDLSRVAQVSRRLLWVADKDPNAFNRISAVRGMERIIRVIGMSPLDPAAYFQEVDAAEGIQQDARLRGAGDAIKKLFGRPDRGTLGDIDRDAYLAALRDLTIRPVPRADWSRRLIRITWSVFVSEVDPEVKQAARTALQRSIYFAVCNGLRSALVPLGEDDYPRVRIEALYVYRRLGGIDAISFLLRMMAPPTGAREHRYDRDKNVRMALVRICAQLKYEHAARGRPNPLEFLYETAADEDEESDIRRVALEGLARCLHEIRGEPRISMELDWANEWWKRYITERK